MRRKLKEEGPTDKLTHSKLDKTNGKREVSMRMIFTLLADRLVGKKNN